MATILADLVEWSSSKPKVPGSSLSSDWRGVNALRFFVMWRLIVLGLIAAKMGKKGHTTSKLVSTQLAQGFRRQSVECPQVRVPWWSWF